MCASGNYKRGSVPEESDFIPAAVRAEQSKDSMVAELMKLQQK